MPEVRYPCLASLVICAHISARSAWAASARRSICVRLIVSTALNNPAGIEFGQPSCRDIGEGFIDISLERRNVPVADRTIGNISIASIGNDGRLYFN